MTQWQRRSFIAPGLTQVPTGPHLAELTTQVARATQSLNRSSGAIGLYSASAGANLIHGVGSDPYGNAAGHEYDLIDDGSLSHARVAVVKLCREVSLFQPRVALERKGFSFIELSGPTAWSGQQLSASLADAAELWVISDSCVRLTADAVDVIEDFFRSGRGVYIWGDNDPYFADANVILRRLFGVAMFGNFPGDRVVPMCSEMNQVGLVPGHLVTTGLVNVYEGITIAEVATTESLRPLIYASDGRVVTAAYDQEGCRAIVDGGFTRLYNRWESAGTDRYIVNAAAWLLNVERFGEAAFTQDS